MIILAVALALLVGVSLGLLGGGGSILAVPLLVYVAGLDPHQAVATSLFVVGVTSVVGLVPHARAGRVRWSTGLVFGVGGMTRGRRGGGGAGELHPLRAVGLGVAVGLVTGFVGAGGGFLIVPALVLIGGLPMSAAVGTSLLVITMQSAAGLAGHLSGAHLPWSLALAVAVTAIAGSLIGGRLNGRFDQETLRRGFGWFVVGMGLLVLGQQLPHQLVASGLPWVAVALAAAWLAVVMTGAIRNARSS